MRNFLTIPSFRACCWTVANTLLGLYVASMLALILAAIAVAS